MATQAPTFEPRPGAYAGMQWVTLTSATAGASIRYTTDGSEPSATNGMTYAAPGVRITGSVKIRAIAMDAAGDVSPVADGQYSVSPSFRFLPEWWRVGLSALVGILGVLAAMGIATYATLYPPQDPLNLAQSVIYVTAVIVGLFSAMMLASVILAALGMSDSSQAFGLPRGSIRAFIAVGIIALMAVVPLLLLSQFSGGVQTIPGLTKRQSEDLVLKLGTDVVTTVTVAPVTPSTAPTYNVLFRNSNKDGQEFARLIFNSLFGLANFAIAYYFALRSGNGWTWGPNAPGGAQANGNAADGAANGSAAVGEAVAPVPVAAVITTP